MRFFDYVNNDSPDDTITAIVLVASLSCAACTISSMLIISAVGYYINIMSERNDRDQQTEQNVPNEASPILG